MFKAAGVNQTATGSASGSAGATKTGGASGASQTGGAGRVGVVGAGVAAAFLGVVAL